MASPDLAVGDDAAMRAGTPYDFGGRLGTEPRLALPRAESTAMLPGRA